MPPSLRKLALTVHVVASIGWIGAVAAFLALAVAGHVSADARLMRAGNVAMDVIYQMVVAPIGLASLISGVACSLGTEWGLFRYYWIVVKLLITAPAVFLMLVHLAPVRYAAQAAAAGISTTGLQAQLVGYAVVALIVLLTATVLSTYKPRGKTRYGVRRLARRSL
jgi:hypothetical protein